MLKDPLLNMKLNEPKERNVLWCLVHMMRLNEDQNSKQTIEGRVNKSRGKGRVRKSWLHGTEAILKKGRSEMFNKQEVV